MFDAEDAHMAQPGIFYSNDPQNITKYPINIHKCFRSKSKRQPFQAQLWEMTEAVADALERAELRLMERAELGVAGESSLGALGSMAASMAEAKLNMTNSIRFPIDRGGIPPVSSILVLLV